MSKVIKSALRGIEKNLCFDKNKNYTCCKRKVKINTYATAHAEKWNYTLQVMVGLLGLHLTQ